MRALAVFCGSRPGGRAEYADAAASLGRAMAARGVALVYGGARVGLMGTVADAVLAAGGQAIGVIPAFMQARELAHEGLTELHVTRTMHERKALMAERADGFVALPGGIGTLEELFEAWTWGQIGVHTKPCALLDVAGFYSGLAGWLDHAHAEGFMRAAPHEELVVEASPERLLDRLQRLPPRPSSAPARATTAEF